MTADATKVDTTAAFATRSGSEDAIWPRGCGDPYSEPTQPAPLARCLPDRFFFSYADGELPSTGADIYHLHDVLNRTEPGALPREHGVPPILAVTPTMLYGIDYVPRAHGAEGWLVRDWAAYYAGTLSYKKLGAPR